MNKSLDPTVELDPFYQVLRTYPFRTDVTVTLVSGDKASSEEYLQKCTSIIDGTHTVVNCVDPPVPTNWWVVSLSLLLIICTVLLWAWGYRNAQIELKNDKIRDTVDDLED